MKTKYINEFGENWLIFVAEDGEEFDSPEECSAYEYALMLYENEQSTDWWDASGRKQLQ